MNKIKVLLIEDDISLGSVYTMGLQHLGFEVHYLSSFIAVVSTINEFQPNIVILDVEIGAKNGIDESATIFDLFPNLPVIFISSHVETECVQRAIKQGGASYLKKPFDIEELGVYINRFATENSKIIGVGKFQYDPTTLQLSNVTTNESLKMSNKEGSILLLLIKNINKTLSRTQIEEAMWSDKDVMSNFMINNIISRLRKAISSDPSIQITTVPRVGYKLTYGK
ncbi:MAG: response regulator transcription factor [Rikenellaceae bacterium]